jgi:hypothetical protein
MSAMPSPAQRTIAPPRIKRPMFGPFVVIFGCRG